MKIDVSQRGLRRAAFFFRRMAKNARQLYPLANKARERWHESEARTFAEKVGWAPRKPSTLLRYRYPIRTTNGVRKGRAKNKGVGFFAGTLHRGLTKPHQKGIKDVARVRRGALTLDVGIKGGRQPRVHGLWFQDGAGARPPRPLVVNFDAQAKRDLAEDTVSHVVPRVNT